MKDFRILLSVAFAMACLGLQAEQLSGSMSNRENAFYALGADAQLELEARDFAPNATVKATLTIHDEFEKELERRGLKFTTDASGAWKGSVPLPTARYGFYRVRVAVRSLPRREGAQEAFAGGFILRTFRRCAPSGRVARLPPPVWMADADRRREERRGEPCQTPR